MQYLEGLNERQKEAVLHTDGPLLIVAGAGAGKTKTITHRIAHLIERGVPARSILAVTFTNKAAEEMRGRIARLLPKHLGGLPAAPRAAQAGMPLVSTFHSLGVRILREFHKEADLPRNFSIWDRDDSLRAIKKALDEIKHPEWKPAGVLSAISRKKGDGMSQKEYAGQASGFREQAIAEAWKIYDKMLHEQGALDFDDLLLRTLSLLRYSPRVLKLLQARWSHITIDEYQDTNRSQYEIARLLAGEKNNICVVGDTDQNVYSWRGSDVEHLLSFEKTFPGAKVVLLEQNYRSTRTILSAANSIIEKNMRRKKKHLFTENGTGEPIVFYGAQNEMDEAYFLAATAQGLIEAGTPAGEIAVLYRENFQSRAIEEALLRFGLPYRVLGTRFFERKEVKDALSYIRAALNPRSKLDIARIAGVPPRGIGAVTLEKMFAPLEKSPDGTVGAETASLAGRSLTGSGENEFPAALRAKVEAFRELLSKIGTAIATLPASEALRFAVEASGMEKMLKRDKEEGRERLLNVHELVNLATKYDYETPPQGMERVLEEAALMSEQDEPFDSAHGKPGRNREGISLMTGHASKGLEFDAVFITGLEQGLFPSLREDENKDPEEERRLFYVALTRARKQVFLTSAAQRLRYGSREYTTPSEFLEDIDPRLLAAPRREVAEREIVID